MTYNTLDNGILSPGDLAEHVVQENTSAAAVAVKAPSTNKADVLVGEKANPTFPLSPGEGISLNLKGAKLFYKLLDATDKLHWITVSS